MMKKKVSIIIPNFNGEILLKTNLSKVVKASNGAEIIIVDDASSDGSIEFITRKFHQIKLIKHHQNQGFASTVNDGVKVASGDFILLLNSDVIPTNDFINPLLTHFDSPDIFAVGSLQKSEQKRGQDTHGRGIAAFKNGFLIHAPGNIDKKDTLWVFGGAGLYRKDIWQKLGGMNSIYNPFYWEDIDLSYRALKSGYRLIFEKGSVVKHLQLQGAIRMYHKPFYIDSIAFRNQIVFVWLNITDLNYLFDHIRYLPWYFLKSIFQFNFAFIYGLLLAIFKLPQAIYIRNQNKKMFLKTDSEVLEPFREEISSSMLK